MKPRDVRWWHLTGVCHIGSNCSDAFGTALFTDGKTEFQAHKFKDGKIMVHEDMTNREGELETLTYWINDVLQLAAFLHDKEQKANGQDRASKQDAYYDVRRVDLPAGAG